MTKKWHILLIPLLIAACLSGCETTSRYRMLCFLFDGVPPPQGLEPCDEKDRKKGPERRTTKGDGTALAAGQYNAHGPYDAKLCEGCHQRQTNKLLMPVEELCQYCHVFNIVKKNVHGPLASGGCIVCHDPHGSGNQYLLVAKSEEFCLYCHQRPDIAKRDVHKNMNGGCTNCHNAHASNNAYLLKEAPGPEPEVSPWGKPAPKPADKNVAKKQSAKLKRPSKKNAATAPAFGAMVVEF